ncbi:unnamed protein product [Polarella glacialis]|uniref:Uncharacterized protein n=1 Tax=Polarella glacialis TaxID=89957 RepID=A0A813H642_POLGL|nr:unnamed protein product [Polarella glacialis]
MEPHICAARAVGTPQFDSAQERALVGFVDRGLRRYRPESKGGHHRHGWTSGEVQGGRVTPGTPEEAYQTLVSQGKVRLAASALQHGQNPSEPVRQGTPFASPAASSRQKVEPTRTASVSNPRLVRWEHRRAAHEASRGNTGAG